jgi:hypothetical protein
MPDILPKRRVNPFVVFNPPDSKEQNLELGGKPSAQQSVDPTAPKTGDPNPYSRKKKQIIKEALKDHIRRRQIRLYRVDETLIPSEPATKWVNDFLKSDNPVLEGKSVQDRVRMAIGSYYSSLKEAHTLADFKETLGEFLSFASAYIGINEMPKITLKNTPEYSPEAQTFGVYSPSERAITLSVTNRHPMDVFRSLAHELVHHKQNEDEVLQSESGQTGSEHENEANSVAGVIMRDFAKSNPEFFKADPISESTEKTLVSMAQKKLVGMATSFIKSKLKSRPSSSPKAAAKPEPSPDETFKKKVDKGVERERVRAEIKRRAGEREKDASTAKTTFTGYTSAIRGAAVTPNTAARKEYINDARSQAEKLKSQGVNVNPAGDLNSLRHSKHRLTNPKKRPPPPADARLSRGVTPPSPKPRSIGKDRDGKPFAVYESVKLEMREAVALMRKADHSNIPYDVILEVYNRGFSDWKPHQNLTREQYAFNRVNSFIAGGKSRTELDTDLMEYLPQPENESK